MYEFGGRPALELTLGVAEDILQVFRVAQFRFFWSQPAGV
jgi:hypothetical protein